MDKIPQASIKPPQNIFFTVFQYMSFSPSVPQYHCSASLSLTPNQQLTASDFYSSPCFFYLSPPATICFYPTLAWHHLFKKRLICLTHSLSISPFILRTASSLIFLHASSRLSFASSENFNGFLLPIEYRI